MTDNKIIIFPVQRRNVIPHPDVLEARITALKYKWHILPLQALELLDSAFQSFIEGDYKGAYVLVVLAESYLILPE